MFITAAQSCAPEQTPEQRGHDLLQVLIDPLSMDGMGSRKGKHGDDEELDCDVMLGLEARPPASDPAAASASSYPLCCLRGGPSGTGIGGAGRASIRAGVQGRYQGLGQ